MDFFVQNDLTFAIWGQELGQQKVLIFQPKWAHSTLIVWRWIVWWNCFQPILEPYGLSNFASNGSGEYCPFFSENFWKILSLDSLWIIGGAFSKWIRPINLCNFGSKRRFCPPTLKTFKCVGPLNFGFFSVSRRPQYLSEKSGTIPHSQSKGKCCAFVQKRFGALSLVILWSVAGGNPYPKLLGPYDLINLGSFGGHSTSGNVESGW